MQVDSNKAFLELFYNVSRELASSLNLNTVLSRVLYLSTQNVGAERGSLIALNEFQKPIAAALVYDGQMIPYSVSEIQSILDRGLAGWVLKNQEAALIVDTSKDQRWLKRPDDNSNITGPKSAICIPIILGGEQLVGVITIVHPVPGFFTSNHMEMLQAIADQACIVIYNAILYENLQGAHQRYLELFEDSIDPIFISDWKGTILEANRKACINTGYESLEMPQHTIYDFHNVDPSIFNEKSGSLHSMETIQYESYLTSRTGSQVPVEVFVRKVFIEGGEYLQWLMRDISERKAFDTLREELIAMIYHDLRSPLSNVVSGMELLKPLLPQNEESVYTPYIGIISRSLARLQRLINSLLDINRLESGQNITRMSKVILPDLIKEAIEEVNPGILSKRQNISNEISGDIPVLNIDEEMIRRVLINLLENAVKFTPFDGSIKVGASQEDKNIIIWVEDSGPGIPEEDITHIFNKFARLQSRIVPKGIGLGLAFCRLAVLAHGGKIWVQNQDGTGSKFSFSIPARQGAK